MACESDQRKAVLERIIACDAPTLRRLAALLVDERDAPADSGADYIRFLRLVAESDVSGLKTSEKSYGNSWKRRGGVDTFHMLTRKWDRIERHVATNGLGGGQSASPYDILEHISADRRADGLIDDVRDLRRYLMLVEAETLARKAGNLADSGRAYLDQLDRIAETDIGAIEEKEKTYGSSWKRRGGISAFMMLARKWDRIEQRVSTRVEAVDGAPGAERDNVLEHVMTDRRSEGIIDDIRDLRRYLILVEAEMAARGVVKIGTARDNIDKG